MWKKKLFCFPTFAKGILTGLDICQKNKLTDDVDDNVVCGDILSKELAKQLDE